MGTYDTHADDGPHDGGAAVDVSPGPALRIVANPAGTGSVNYHEEERPPLHLLSWSVPT